MTASLMEAAALLLARSNNTEDAMGEFIPQAVYDSLYERSLLRMASDQTGECWAVTTTAGDFYLQALLQGRKRVTHGRHCPCSACKQEDWTRISAPCGMHGPECPAVYAPITPDVCHVYVVAATEIAADWPKGDCFTCGQPLRNHEKRVSKMAPPGTGYVIDEEMMLGA